MLKGGVTEFASLLCSLQVMLDFVIRFEGIPLQNTG
jgi:hypothetical protein